MRHYLPRFCVEAFADPDAIGEPSVWVHRPAIGVFQAAPLAPVGSERHFNVVEDDALRTNDALEPLLARVEDAAASVVRDRVTARAALTAPEREALAAFVALLGLRLSPGFGHLEPAEARRGYEELLAVLRDMGWVFWNASPPDYFVSSSAPFHVAFPADDPSVVGGGLHARGVEITLPLTPWIALHGTWKRTGELYRSAREELLLELNARTVVRARAFVLAPKPAIPG